MAGMKGEGAGGQGIRDHSNKALVIMCDDWGRRPLGRLDIVPSSIETELLEPVLALPYICF